MNYREFYSKALNVKLSPLFDVHHIDFNRNNNDILNLVALPKWLHGRYHMCLTNFDKPFDKMLNYRSGMGGHNTYNLSLITQSVSIIEQCQLWVDYRNFLLGDLPHNYHNLSYND